MKKWGTGMRKNKLLWIGLLILLIVLGACTEAASNNKGNEQENDTADGPPSVSDLDQDDELTPFIEKGEALLDGTEQIEAEENGDKDSCMSCHADGSDANGVSFIGITSEYPQYDERVDAVITLQEKINNSIVRTLNGEKLDYDGEEMRAIIAYMTYISKGQDYEDYQDEKIVEDIPEPDLDNGEKLFDEKIGDIAPQLWGEHSFSDGSQMTRMSVLTNYIKNNLPEDDPGSLSDQEAADIAGFALSQDRPEWEDDASDWSEEEKPADFINEKERAAIQKGDFDWSVVNN